MFIALSSRRILALALSTPHCRGMKHNFSMSKCWSVHGFIFASFSLSFCFVNTAWLVLRWLMAGLRTSPAMGVVGQHAKKVVSDSPGLVYFAVGLVNFVLNLANGQVKFFEGFKLQKNSEINSAHWNVFGASWNDVWALHMLWIFYLQLAWMASFKNITFFASC